ncbi:flagellar basal body P-ring formation protein FlgA [Roseomonas sp. M0104]|uniref:Flagella basal body P-ring formation protein FlgA n=1 Tax=Teichococcus coralli TaxID=2545983 RepID=A0A845BF52_9PROT|nr:flagellar basal body P-ring formation chaperone FlgA [Pseudoroseomonas coralli]MXP65605.1 flagellar basal body P-ring formation protein FlgA [Pseudoroseomonas coralli]
MRLLPLFALAVPLLAGAAPAAAREVWHATRTLERGDILRPQDLEAVPPRRDSAAFIEAARDLVGQEMRRRVRDGLPLRDRDVGEPLAVHSTETVRVFWKSAGVTLELEGRAMEDGAVGEEIRVHNPGSNRTIRAVVVAERTTEVRGAP